MEKNFISEQYETHFYVNLIKKIYGVCVNIKDFERNPKIINEIKEKNKETIQAWKKEWGVEYGILKNFRRL